MNEELKIETQKIEGEPKIVVFHINGYLQANTLQQFKETIDIIFDQNIYHVIFNCEKVRFASSAGLGALMGILDEVESHNGKMIMAKLSMPLAEVFELLDFYDIFTVVNSIEEALEKIK